AGLQRELYFRGALTVPILGAGRYRSGSKHHKYSTGSSF
ncbi:MAG: hypothetical protein ACI8PT_003100, partial [Gammaproteobacteria bacterium]